MTRFIKRDLLFFKGWRIYKRAIATADFASIAGCSNALVATGAEVEDAKP
jgi:hypothetical protein